MKASQGKVLVVIKGITPQGKLAKGNIFEWAEKECKKHNSRKNLRDEYEIRKEQGMELDETDSGVPKGG